jgi:hypothetical protein
VETDYEALVGRLKAVGCPYKLYPARLRALGVVTGERLLPKVAEVITMRIFAAGARNKAWKQQFERDFETYGLSEAIGYFHSYPPLAGEFVEDACRLYERLANLYLEYHEQIMASDDPRVQAQLQVLSGLGDPTEHVGPRARHPPRVAPDGIAAAQRPPAIAQYQRNLPVHPATPWLTDETDDFAGPQNFADELIENFATAFMVEGFPSIQGAFFEVARVLDDYQIDVFGSEGQYVLATLVEYLDEEMFGDFDRWIPCIECSDDFLVKVSLASVNDSLLAGAWRCNRCRDESEGPPPG